MFASINKWGQVEVRCRCLHKRFNFGFVFARQLPEFFRHFTIRKAPRQPLCLRCLQLQGLKLTHRSTPVCVLLIRDKLFGFQRLRLMISEVLTNYRTSFCASSPSRELLFASTRRIPANTSAVAVCWIMWPSPGSKVK
jgi:hypothetical protein